MIWGTSLISGWLYRSKTEMSDSLRSMTMPQGGDGIKSIVGSLRRFGACRRGTSAVEFCLVLAPMVLFLFGIIGFGLVTYAHNNMVNAAREATRRLSVAEDVVVAADTTVACGSAAYDTLVAAAAALVPPRTAVEQVACDYLTDWTITFNVTATECDPVELGIDPNFRDVTVLITTIASDAFMVDLWGLFSGNLEAEVTMRREAACA